MKYWCTFIIPFYNEEKLLPNVIKKITKINNINNIFLVNDWSRDNSLKVAKKYSKSHKNIKIISYTQNKWKSWAIFEWLKKVVTNYVFLFDADLKNIKIKEIENVINTMYNHSKIDMSILRRIMPKRYIKLLYRELILSGQRMLKTSDLKSIYKNNFNKYQLEIAINDFMEKNKKNVVRFPFSAENTFKSKKRWFFNWRKKDISMFLDIFKYKWLFFYIKHSLSFSPYNIKNYIKMEENKMSKNEQW